MTNVIRRLKIFKKYLLYFVLLHCRPNQYCFQMYVSYIKCVCSVVSSTKSVQADRKSVLFTTMRHQETQKPEDGPCLTTKVQQT